MPTATRRRTTRTAAIAASVVAHVALLTALLLYKPVLIVPEEPGGPPVAVIPILLLPRTPPATAGGAPQGQLRLHRRAQRFAAAPPPVAPLVTAAPVAPALAKAEPSTAAPIAAAPPGPARDLRAALRHGPVGCANRAGLSRAERDLCDERLGKAAASDAYIPTPLEPRIRAYYDAVADAKKPDPQPVRPGHDVDMYGRNDDRGSTGHGPGVGCHIAFGAGRTRKGPAHALSLGPCFIEPPKGPWTVEVDVPPP